MSDSALALWFVHSVTVERYTGSEAYGDTYASPATLTGFVDTASRPGTGNGLRLVDRNGQEVVATFKVFLPAGTAAIPPGSRVTLPAEFGGRRTTVIADAVHSAPGLGLPEHVELAVA